MISGKNFSNQIVPFEIDTEYKDCNFSHSNCLTVFGQKVGHRIFPDDDTPRTFIDCNMINCEPPPGSNLINSRARVVERMVVVNSEIINIDDEQIVAKDYVDKLHGTYLEGRYIYHSIPIEVPRGTG